MNTHTHTHTKKTYCIVQNINSPPLEPGLEPLQSQRRVLHMSILNQVFTQGMKEVSTLGREQSTETSNKTLSITSEKKMYPLETNSGVKAISCKQVKAMVSKKLKCTLHDNNDKGYVFIRFIYSGTSTPVKKHS